MLCRPGQVFGSQVWKFSRGGGKPTAGGAEPPWSPHFNHCLQCWKYFMSTYRPFGVLWELSLDVGEMYTSMAAKLKLRKKQAVLVWWAKMWTKTQKIYLV